MTAVAGIAIKPLDLGDSGVISDITGIAVGAGFDFAPEKLVSNLRESSADSICLGAFVEGELAAINAFIAHEVLIAGQRFNAFQSGWSATSPAHQGKGLFTGLIKEAKRLLADMGAPFIFGFPNSVSEPIFLKKLGFTRTPMRRVLLPTSPKWISRLMLDVARYYRELAAPEVVRFNQYENLRWKRREHPELVAVDSYRNLLWGRVVERQVPILGERKVLLAGGCELSKPQLLGSLLSQLRQKHGVEFVRFVVAEHGMLANASRWTLKGDRTTGLL